MCLGIEFAAHCNHHKFSAKHLEYSSFGQFHSTLGNILPEIINKSIGFRLIILFIITSHSIEEINEKEMNE